MEVFLKQTQLALYILPSSVALPTQRLLTGRQKCTITLRNIIQGKVFFTSSGAGMAEGVISNQFSLNV